MPLTPEQLEMLRQSVAPQQPSINPENRPALSGLLPGLYQSPEPVKTNYEQQILDMRKQALANIGGQSSVK